MTRTTLNRILLLWTMTWVILLLAGCTTAWTTEATSIITLLGPAISSILGILSAFGLGLAPTVLATFQKWSVAAGTDLEEVKSLIDQYNTAEAAAQPGLLVEIQTIISEIAANLSAILPDIKVTDPTTQAKIVAVVQAVSSELEALIALIPALQGKVTGHAELKKLIHDNGLKTAKEFKADFNEKAAPFGAAYKI